MRYFLRSLDSFGGEVMDGCHEWLPPGMAEAVGQIANPTRRREKVAAYCLLVEGLKQMGLYERLPLIEYADSGKPYLANYEGLHFNLSHCRSHVAVAIDEHTPVGIDVESRRKFSASLIRRVCSAAEQKLIAEAADPDMEFLRLWTRKEAYLKYTGTGIVEPLANVPPHITIHNSQFTIHKIETHPLPDGDGWVSVCWETGEL